MTPKKRKRKKSYYDCRTRWFGKTL